MSSATLSAASLDVNANVVIPPITAATAAVMSANGFVATILFSTAWAIDADSSANLNFFIASLAADIILLIPITV